MDHGVPCWVYTAQPDPERGAGFYGGPFGWEAMEMGSGFWSWRLPGHGKPFADTVAWLVPRDPQGAELSVSA